MREPTNKAEFIRFIHHELDEDPGVPPVRWFHWLLVLAVGVLAGLVTYLVVR